MSRWCLYHQPCGSGEHNGLNLCVARILVVSPTVISPEYLYRDAVRALRTEKSPLSDASDLLAFACRQACWLENSIGGHKTESCAGHLQHGGVKKNKTIDAIMMKQLKS